MSNKNYLYNDLSNSITNLKRKIELQKESPKPNFKWISIYEKELLQCEKEFSLLPKIEERLTEEDKKKFGRIKDFNGDIYNYILENFLDWESYDEIGKNNSSNRKALIIFSINGIRYRILKHVLLAKKYIPNPKNLPGVRHINGNYRDNSLTNLQWVNRNKLETRKKTNKRKKNESECNL